MQRREGSSTLGKADWLAAGAFGVLAALLYLPSLADFAFPGESARLIAVWRGLDVAKVVPYPLMAAFAKAMGCGNAIAAVCGAVATACVFILATFFVRLRTDGENMLPFAVGASRLAGCVAAAMFMLAPAVRSAASHVEPRLFAVSWMLLSLLAAIPWARSATWLGALLSVAFGAMWGAGLADSALFAVMLPLALVAVVGLSLRTGRKPYLETALFLFSYMAAFLLVAALMGGDVEEAVKTVWDQVGAYSDPDGWMLVMFFSTVPFVVSLFSSGKAYNEESGWVQWTFHISMGFASILAIATPLAPAALMEPSGVEPVATSLFAAFVAGYLAAYWLFVARAAVRVNESHDKVPVAAKGRLIAYLAGGTLAAVYAFSALFALFTFDSRRGEFADKVAARIIDDLGGRKWIVTDGSLDNHLRLAAAGRGVELNVVSLNRDLDPLYIEALTATVKAAKLGGDKCSDLALSLSLGVLPFVQDWFAGDAAATSEVAVFGAPDLWYAAGRTPVPELFFFGADPSRKPDWSAWDEFDKILFAPDEWGSYRMRGKTRNPVDILRLELRRHMGFVANNRGYWLQDQGRDDDAFAMYDLVLEKIDRDNICALFNMFEMAKVKGSKASARRFDCEKRLKAIVADQSRRYRLWALSTYYGYIRNPDVLVRTGFGWARSGRPGEALAQMRRAIDFVPTDRRSSILNMMAALYASDEDRAKARETYEKILAGNSSDHDALIGMMRLSLIDGDSKRALEFLDRAVAAGGDDPRVKTERAMAAMMRQDFVGARKLLSQVIDANANDMRAWSLLAAVVMQQLDAVKDDPAASAAFEKELEDSILPAMDKNSQGPNDYYVQTTRAFLLLKKGKDRRREARDAFAVAVKVRPDVTTTQDLMMGLDISLDDPESAERHAREVLRRNRNSPLANYIMGSLALKRGDDGAAERYLHKSADAARPVVMAMNDLAELYRRGKRFQEAERYARLAVKTDPRLYVAWETLGSILVESSGDMAEARSCIEKACEMSMVDGRSEDVRMLIALARVQMLQGDKKMARVSLRKVQSRLDELSAFEKKEYDELMKNVR